MIGEKGACYTQMESMSDEQLCALIRNEDRMAAEILAARYHQLVRRCARPYFLAGGDSEDLQQEGMFGLIKAMREYDQQRDAQFRTFAETCIRNRLYSVLRASVSGKNQLLNQSVPLHPSFFESNLSFAQVDPEVQLIDREKTAALLEDTRRQLSEFEKTVLELYLDGLTYRQIAKAVDKDPKSVDNAVQRIRKKLARHINFGEISK